MFYLRKPPENLPILSQAYLHLESGAHLPPKWLVLFQHRNVRQSYDKFRLSPVSLKCQAIETEKGKLLKIISTQPEYKACTMVGIHAPTKMFVYLPQWNSKCSVCAVLP